METGKILVRFLKIVWTTFGESTKWKFTCSQSNLLVDISSWLTCLLPCFIELLYNTCRFITSHLIAYRSWKEKSCWAFILLANADQCFSKTQFSPVLCCWICDISQFVYKRYFDKERCPISLVKRMWCHSRGKYGYCWTLWNGDQWLQWKMSWSESNKIPFLVDSTTFSRFIRNRMPTGSMWVTARWIRENSC